MAKKIDVVLSEYTQDIGEPGSQKKISPETQKSKKTETKLPGNPETQKASNSTKIKATYELDKQLVKTIKKLAIDREQTISQLVETILRKGLDEDLI